MKFRRFVEEMEEQKRLVKDDLHANLVECPALNDVVFKTGTASLSHPGNAIFRELLYANYDTYFKAKTNASKQDAVTRIIQDVVRRNGKFLEWSNSSSCWVIMQDASLIGIKVYNSLFYFKKTFNAKKNMQVNISSTSIFERQDGKKRKRESDGNEA